MKSSIKGAAKEIQMFCLPRNYSSLTSSNFQAWLRSKGFYPTLFNLDQGTGRNSFFGQGVIGLKLVKLYDKPP